MPLFLPVLHLYIAAIATLVVMAWLLVCLTHLTVRPVKAESILLFLLMCLHTLHSAWLTGGIQSVFVGWIHKSISDLLKSLDFKQGSDTLRNCLTSQFCNHLPFDPCRVYQQIPLALPSKDVQNPTTSTNMSSFLHHYHLPSGPYHPSPGSRKEPPDWSFCLYLCLLKFPLQTADWLCPLLKALFCHCPLCHYTPTDLAALCTHQAAPISGLCTPVVPSA